MIGKHAKFKFIQGSFILSMTNKLNAYTKLRIYGDRAHDLQSVRYTQKFKSLTSHDFIGGQASQNKVILSVQSGVKFTIGLNTSTPTSQLPSKMTLNSPHQSRRPCGAPVQRDDYIWNCSI